MTTAIGNQTEANRETIREAFEAWKNGTGSITDVFAPEMVWRIEGRVPRRSAVASQCPSASSSEPVPTPTWFAECASWTR